MILDTTPEWYVVEVGDELMPAAFFKNEDDARNWAKSTCIGPFSCFEYRIRRMMLWCEPFRED